MFSRALRHLSKTTALDRPARAARCAGGGASREPDGRLARLLTAPVRLLAVAPRACSGGVRAGRRGAARGRRDRHVSVAFSYNPTPRTPLGLMAKVTPSWGGQASGGARALWGQQPMAGMPYGGMATGSRLEAELGYGRPVGSRLVGTPWFAVGTSSHGRDYRLGYGMRVAERGALRFELVLTPTAAKTLPRWARPGASEAGSRRAGRRPARRRQ